MNGITMVQFVEFEDVTTSPALDNDWEQQVVANARGDEITAEEDQDSDSDDNNVSGTSVTQSLTSLKAIQLIADFKNYAVTGRNTELLTTMQTAEDLLEDDVRGKNETTTLHSFLQY